MKLRTSVFGAVALLVTSGAARAACPSPLSSTPALAARSTTERARFLRATLENQASRSAWWNWGFTTLGYALGATQFTLGFTTKLDGGPGEHNQKAFLLVNATRATLGATWTLVQPLRVSTLSLSLPLGPDEPTQCAWLARAEADLVTTADYQRRHRTPLKHVVVAASALVSGLVLGLGFSEWKLAGASAGMAVVLGEAQIWLQPTGAAGQLERYQQGAISTASSDVHFFAFGAIRPNPRFTLGVTF
jgi:hypothetical protein